jgi:hypothetical protein
MIMSPKDMTMSLKDMIMSPKDMIISFTLLDRKIVSTV